MRSHPKAVDITAAKKYTKSFFSSLTFWSLFFLAVEGVAGHVETVLSTSGELKLTDLFAVIRIVAATAAGFAGRYNAEKILWTPKGLPGRDYEDAEELAERFLMPPNERIDESSDNRY